MSDIYDPGLVWHPFLQVPRSTCINLPIPIKNTKNVQELLALLNYSNRPDALCSKFLIPTVCKIIDTHKDPTVLEPIKFDAETDSFICGHHLAGDKLMVHLLIGANDNAINYFSKFVESISDKHYELSVYLDYRGFQDDDWVDVRDNPMWGKPEFEYAAIRHAYFELQNQFTK